MSSLLNSVVFDVINQINLSFHFCEVGHLDALRKLAPWRNAHCVILPNAVSYTLLRDRAKHLQKSNPE